MQWLGKSRSRSTRFFLAALVTFICLNLVWAGAEILTGFRVQPPALRLALLGLLLVVGLGAGALAARRTRQGAQPVDTAPQANVPESISPDRLARLAQAARSNADQPEPVAEQPPEAETFPAGPTIAAARRRPIVFRQSFPPGGDHGLSYYGGRPTGPAGFEWPRHATDDGAAPLSFVLQWNCRELAAQDATGLLPRDGVLYFFADLNWGHKEAYRFLHLPGSTDGWSEIDPPADLGPILGGETAWQVPWCSQAIAPEHQDCPVLLPKWPFRPLGFDYPADPDGDPEGSAFWSEKSAAEALIAAQNSLGAPLMEFAPDRKAAAPFPAFPHDWAAVRIVCSMVIDTLRKPEYTRLPKAIEELESEARAARIAEWRDEATELYVFAASHPLTDPVPVDLSAQIRAWMDKVNGCFFYSQAVEKSVNASLGLGSAALSVIPPSQIDRASLNHMLGLAYDREEYRHEFRARCHPDLDQAASNVKWEEAHRAGQLPIVRSLHAPIPNRIFGPPSYVQGGVEELVEDHLLLLEISSSSHIGIELGEGVIQYMIRPDDLRHGRFDRAEVIMSAY